nr:hypothetical protein [uncultured Oscillibacter sp.]
MAKILQAFPNIRREAPAASPNHTINHQLYHPEYLLTPFNRASLESSFAESIPLAKHLLITFKSGTEVEQKIEL